MEMNENPYINDVSRSGAAGMSGFMLGAIVGAGVALLFAPATGTDTRRRLGETAKKLGSAARDRIQEGKEQIRDRIQEGKEQVRDRFEAGRQGFEAGRQGSSEPGRREPVPSAPGQTGSRTTPGKTGVPGSTYTP
jgi:gas vesicle protein